MLTHRNRHSRSPTSPPDRPAGARAVGPSVPAWAASLRSHRHWPVPRRFPDSPASAAAIPGDIGLAEYRLDVPGLRFLHRTCTFTAVNIGRAPHALAINGPGHIHRSTPVLARGQSAHLALRLHHGRCELTCLVGNHTQQGMGTPITVG